MPELTSMVGNLDDLCPRQGEPSSGPATVVVPTATAPSSGIMPKDVREPLPAGWQERLREKWPCSARLTAAWEMAANLDSLHDLLAGQPVDVARLKPEGYRSARQRRLITLSRPVEYFDISEAV